MSRNLRGVSTLGLWGQTGRGVPQIIVDPVAVLADALSAQFSSARFLVAAVILNSAAAEAVLHGSRNVSPKKAFPQLS
jgi:hypothetical protein